MHPDHARDEEEAAVRNDWMTRANAAYRRQDVEELKHLLDRFQGLLRPPPEEDLSATAFRLVRLLGRMRQTLERLAGRLEELQRSDLALLEQEVAKAKENGIDLLDSRAGELRQRIAQARERLDGLRR